MTNEATENPSKAKSLLYLMIVVLLSLVVFKFLLKIHQLNYQELADTAHGILQGKPTCLAFQNRLLAPTIVFVISKVGISYCKALKIYDFLTILIHNLLVFLLLRKLNISYRNSLTWLIVYSFAFMGFQDHILFTWDNIDIIIFTLFAWGILRIKPTSFFIALFFIGLLNRESALFIALYIIIDSFSIDTVTLKPTLVSKLRLACGSTLLVLGLIYVKFMRHLFFIITSKGTADAEHQLIGNHLYPIVNLKTLFYYNLFNTNIINSAFIFGATIFMFYFVRRYKEPQIKALIIYSIILSAIFVFGLINETRLYFILFPFILFFMISIDDTSIFDPPQANEIAAINESSAENKI